MLVLARGGFDGARFSGAMSALIGTVQRIQDCSPPMFSKEIILSPFEVVMRSYDQNTRSLTMFTESLPNILGTVATYSLALLDLLSRSSIG